MARIEPACKTVEEVPAGGGGTGEDRQVLPAERDYARPLAGVADGLPGAILCPPEGPPEGPRALASGDLSRDGRRLGSPTRKLGEARSAERATSEQDRDPFEEVRFTLGVTPDEEVQIRRGVVGKGTVITKFEKLYPSNLHPVGLPVFTAES